MDEKTLVLCDKRDKCRWICLLKSGSPLGSSPEKFRCALAAEEVAMEEATEDTPAFPLVDIVLGEGRVFGEMDTVGEYARLTFWRSAGPGVTGKTRPDGPATCMASFLAPATAEGAKCFRIVMKAFEKMATRLEVPHESDRLLNVKIGDRP